MDTSSTEAQAARLTHRTSSFAGGRGVLTTAGAASSAPSTCAGVSRETQAVNPHNSTKPAYTMLQPQACSVEASFGSTKNGKLSRPSIDPKFESAKSL